MCDTARGMAPFFGRDTPETHSRYLRRFNGNLIFSTKCALLFCSVCVLADSIWFGAAQVAGMLLLSLKASLNPRPFILIRRLGLEC